MPRGKHDNHAKADRVGRWSERKFITNDGYVKLRVGKTHPIADPNGYAYEHLVIWCAAGRERPKRGWLLHHKNEVKTDNRIENLELLPRASHSVGHNKTALSDEHVRAIRIAHANGEGDTAVLAKRFSVPTQRVWKIVRGKTRLSAGGPIHKEPLR